MNSKWIENRIKPGEYEKYLENGDNFINEAIIKQQLQENTNPDRKQIEAILAKSLAVETLTPEETALLLNVDEPELLQLMQQTASEVKNKVYDNRIVVFAPLYLNNLCVNNCLYCGFRSDNTQAKRRILNAEEIKKETEVLAGKIGHKRLIVVYGEALQTDIDYMVDSIKTIYSVEVPARRGTGTIRRVNVNAPPLQVKELEKLRAVGIGTYQVFQETYHRPTYEKIHPAGTLKGDYNWRLYCMHRAFEAGIDDLGIGALFGLYDWKYEVMGLLQHARELEEKFGVGPHTISFPRLEPASGAPLSQNSEYKVSDPEFEKLVTVLRLAIPYTGLIITAREDARLRDKTMALGCTQTDASTRIGIGAYSDYSENQDKNRQQFMLGDTRNLDQFVRDMADQGYITSFCTAGYRCGRTGECIMELLRSGKEGDFCKLNAVLTFQEWLDDFASPKTQQAGQKLITRELNEVRTKLPETYSRLKEYLQRIKNGERDLYF